MKKYGVNWDEKPELNITPLVDIFLVLMAILMVAVPTIVYEENISLPSGAPSKQVMEEKKLDIRIDRNKTVYLGNDQYKLNSFADNFLLYSKGKSKKTKIYIRADKRLIYEDVMFVLKSVKEAGFNHVSLVTNGK